MKKIDHATAVSNTFTDGNPSTGTPATVVPAEFLNAIQTELVTIIEGAGITLDGADNTQVKEAIDTLISTAITAAGILVGTLGEQDDDSVDINGGNIDGTDIGASSAKTGKFSSLEIEAAGTSVLNFKPGTGDGNTRYYDASNVLRMSAFYDVSAHTFRTYSYNASAVSEGEIFRYGATHFMVNSIQQSTIDFIAKVGAGTALQVDASANIVSVNPAQNDINFQVETIAGSSIFSEASSNYVRLGQNAVDIDTYICSLEGYAIQVNAGSSLVHINPSNNNINFTVDTENLNNAFLIDASSDLIDINADIKSAKGQVMSAGVNFNAVGTVAIRESNNVSSITDNGSGDHTVNFTNSMPNADYITQITATGSSMATIHPSTDPTTSSVRIVTKGDDAGYVDSKYVNVSIFSQQ